MARLTGVAVLLLFACSTMPAAAEPMAVWDSLIAESSARVGIPAAWIRRVMVAESGGRTKLDGKPIRSPVGAMGLMQLMPGTWQEMRARHGLGADPHEPRDNILAGTAYLRAMYDRFGYPGLFGAYNAGPRRYAEHISRGTRLPSETVAYMASIAGNSYAARSTAIAATAVSADAAQPARTVTSIFFVVAPRRSSGAAAPGASPSRGALFLVTSGE